MSISRATQLQLLEDTEKPMKIVNVASVPQRSLFRYPGGKTWLIPWVREWLGSASPRHDAILEPFVGGGIVSLTAVAERLVERAVIVELDPEIAAVWKTVVSGDGSKLASMIEAFEPSVETVNELLASDTDAELDVAFRTIVKNRTFHGGIIARGSSPMKNGENGKGIGSRWYARTLVKRIEGIDAIRDRLEFIQGDGIAEIEKHADEINTALFVDPPYTAAGKKAGRRLYNCHELDHDQLFDVCAASSNDLLMTYDNAQDIEEMAISRGLECEAVAMKNTHNARMTELLIGRDVSWARPVGAESGTAAISG